VKSKKISENYDNFHDKENGDNSNYSEENVSSSSLLYLMTLSHLHMLYSIKWEDYEQRIGKKAQESDPVNVGNIPAFM
jgi:hypothetical protein